METWLIYTLLSLFTTGTLNFTYKVAAERNYNISVLNKYTYIVGVIFGFIYFILNFREYPIGNLFIIMFLAFINVSFYSISNFSKVISMKNIDSVIFFPLYKTIGPILVTIISFFFFKETLNLKEILGIIIGISIPLLLINHKENKIQKNLFIGLVFLLITAFLTSISSSASKVIMNGLYNLPFYIFSANFFGLIFSYFTYGINKNNNHKYNNKGLIKLSVFSSVLHFFAFFSFVKALQGNFAIVFTINSFSILIPIILSIIFYKEHLNLRKILVIILSIIAIILFI